jgi:hypothetical protein
MFLFCVYKKARIFCLLCGLYPRRKWPVSKLCHVYTDQLLQNVRSSCRKIIINYSTSEVIHNDWLRQEEHFLKSNFKN